MRLRISSRILYHECLDDVRFSGRRTKGRSYTELCLTSTSPLRASMLDFTTSSPTPRPEISVIFAMEKLGRKQQIDDLFLAHCLSLLPV